MKLLKAVIFVFVILCFSAGTHSKDLLSPSLEKNGIIIPKLLLERSRSEEGESYVGIRDITVDENSAVYAFDYMNYFIKKYDKEGKLLFTFGGTGEEEGKFNHLTGIRAVEGRILAVDSIGLSLFDYEGNFGASSANCSYLIKNAQQAIISKQVKHNCVTGNMPNEV